MKIAISAGLLIMLTCTGVAAHAGPSRGLSLAANEPAQTAEQPAPEPTAAQAAAAVEHPAPVPAEQATAAAPVQRGAATEKPGRKHQSTEARIIFELHRHGIYW